MNFLNYIIFIILYLNSSYYIYAHEFYFKSIILIEFLENYLIQILSKITINSNHIYDFSIFLLNPLKINYHLFLFIIAINKIITKINLAKYQKPRLFYQLIHWL